MTGPRNFQSLQLGVSSSSTLVVTNFPLLFLIPGLQLLSLSFLVTLLHLSLLNSLMLFQNKLLQILNLPNLLLAQIALYLGETLEDHSG